MRRRQRNSGPRQAGISLRNVALLGALCGIVAVAVVRLIEPKEGAATVVVALAVGAVVAAITIFVSKRRGD